MAQALPSFVELIDSLDLKDEEDSDVQRYAHYPASPSFVPSPPSSSMSSPQTSHGKYQHLTSPESATQSFNLYSSPSIVVSHPSPVDDDFATSRRRSISNRYNPYAPSNPYSRRRSLPGDLSSYPDHSHQSLDHHRESSASPPITGRRASLGNTSHEQSGHLSTNRITRSKTDQPISAFVRRRHPYTFPALSPETREATRRSTSPTDTFKLVPVSLPSLPPLPRISIGTESPPFSNATRLPSISVLDHRPTSVYEDHDPESRATSRTPTPPSHIFCDHRKRL